MIFSFTDMIGWTQISEHHGNLLLRVFCAVKLDVKKN